MSDLNSAVARNDIQSARQLIAQGADVNARDRTGFPSLDRAILTCHLKMAKFLVNHGASINTPIIPCSSHLSLTAEVGCVPIINVLLDHGAHINATDCRSLGVEGVWTALMHAAYFGHLDAVKLLLQRGADASIKSPSGKTAESIAASGGYHQIADYIRDYVKSHAPKPVPVVASSAESLDSGLRPAGMTGKNSVARDSSVDTPNYSGRARPADFAVVVGVEKYAQDLPAAQFADRDAEAMRRHLLALGVPARHIVFLHDALATRSELVKNIERWLPKNVKPDSRVYFYFSGHGSPDPQTGQAYLVGFDGDPSDLADTAYPLSRLYAKLGKLKAHRVIVALDSCFSGAGGRSVIAQGARPLVNRIIEGSISPNGKIIALTASKSDQISGILEDKGHGAFTYYLLKGLNGAALDSQDHVTLKSLYQYLKPKVEDAAHLDDRDQDPQLLPPKNPAEHLNLR